MSAQSIIKTAQPAFWQNNDGFADTPEKLRDSSRIRQLKPFEVTLMKGKLWPCNAIGIYHRSPKPEAGKPRLAVKINEAE